MADILYIKAAAFGGYDKSDVDKRLEALYSLIYNLKNEVRECRQLLKKYEEGSSQDKAYESAIAVERAQLTQLQVKNETLTEKNKARYDELKAKEEENAKLIEEITKLKEEVEELRLKQVALKNNDTEDLGIIFIEAKKSRDLIVNNAKQEAATCMEQAKKFSENLIAETNAKIKKLIESADKKTSDVLKEAEIKKKALTDEETKLKQSLLKKLEVLNGEINKIKDSVDTFTTASADFISSSKDIIDTAESKIKEVNETAPVKKNVAAPATTPAVAPAPVTVTPQPAPQTESVKAENTNTPAATQAGENKKKVHVTAKPTVNNNDADSGINLDDLLKQAKELNKV
ncbi:MAG: hypothetical protein IKV85_04985 [Ruminococcus sp.]|nr:hypothetical protein [Ruminococcus sp.]